MFAQLYYLIRSRTDGSYLVAHLNQNSAAKNSTTKDDNSPDQSYLLLFSEHFDALSYLNTHGANVADRFGVESIPGTQLEGLLKRWGFDGIGIVKDPLIPNIEFLQVQSNKD